MINILMLLVFPQSAQFQPCVWPNKCEVQIIESVPFEPCVWPNRCEDKAV